MERMMDEYIAEANIQKRKPIIYFGDNPCYLESVRIPSSHWIGVCEIDEKNYNGYVTEGGYFHAVKILIAKGEKNGR
jgi:hypothetical protein